MHQIAAMMEKTASEGDLTESQQLFARLQIECRKFFAVVGALGLVSDAQ
jgi:hypothetical protein